MIYNDCKKTCYYSEYKYNRNGVPLKSWEQTLYVHFDLWCFSEQVSQIYFNLIVNSFRSAQ